MSIEIIQRSFFTRPDGTRLGYQIFDPINGDNGETIKPRGTIFVVPGRAEFIEKKLAEMQTFVDQGYRLIILELRNQGKSDRILPDGEKRERDHIKSFDIHIADINDLYENVVKPNSVGSIIAHGHSMGAHLLLRWFSEYQPQGISGAFITSPMLAIASRVKEFAANKISLFECSRGRADHYAPPEQDDYKKLQKNFIFEGNDWTQDPLNFQIFPKYFHADESLVVGGITHAWRLSAIRSLNRVRKRSTLKSIKIPVMALVGSLDKKTPAARVLKYLRRIKGIEINIVHGAVHDLFNEIKPKREAALTHALDFTDRILSAN